MSIRIAALRLAKKDSEFREAIKEELHKMRVAGRKTYQERLRDPVSKDDATGHRNLLKSHLMPLEKSLDRLLRSHGSPGDIFEPDEIETLQEARRILAKKSVPFSSLKIKKDKPLLLL